MIGASSRHHDERGRCHGLRWRVSLNLYFRQATECQYLLPPAVRSAITDSEWAHDLVVHAVTSRRTADMHAFPKRRKTEKIPAPGVTGGMNWLAYNPAGDIVAV
jgi:hypothetical protein